MVTRPPTSTSTETLLPYTTRFRSPGDQVFGTNGSNVFDVLTDIVDSLRNDPSALNANLEALDERAVAFRSAHAQVGARYNQVEAMRERTESARLNSKNALAEVESIDQIGRAHV